MKNNNEIDKHFTGYRKPKPLSSMTFTAKVVKELSPTYMLSNRRIRRNVVFECNKCKDNFTTYTENNVVRYGSGCCRACTFDRNTAHPLYRVWSSIIQRCYNPKRKDYNRYGGAGVTVYTDWVDNPSAFIAWCVANGWKHGLHVDKDIKSKALGLRKFEYSPSTISFITPSENIRETARTTDKEVLVIRCDTLEILEVHSTPVDAAENTKCSSRYILNRMCVARMSRKCKINNHFNRIPIFIGDVEVQFIYREKFNELINSLASQK